MVVPHILLRVFAQRRYGGRHVVSAQRLVRRPWEAHGHFETVRQKLRDWAYNDADRTLSGGSGQEVDLRPPAPAGPLLSVGPSLAAPML